MRTEILVSVVQQLNKLLRVDRQLVETLVNNRMPVSSGYMELDDFVYMQDNDADVPTAGLVGILNGLLKLDTHRIAANYDDDMKLIEFIIMNMK